MKFLLLAFLFATTSCLRHPYLDPVFLDDIPETGYIDVVYGSLFYWFFKPRDGNESAPIIIWFTGGPGCPSTAVVFEENGPFNILPDNKLEKNKYSWNENAYVLYLDQPVGTGFSYAKKYVIDQNQVSEDVHTFITKFFEKHPSLSENPLFLAGSSFAGHYIPPLAVYILKQPKNKINLKGVAIGNGFVAPYYHYGLTPEFAYENGLISLPMYALTKVGAYFCKLFIKNDLWLLATAACYLNDIPVIGIRSNPKFNPYDFTKECEGPPFCYDPQPLYSFVNSEKLRERIGVKMSKEFVDMDNYVFLALLVDFWKDYSKEVANLLDNYQLPVLSYNGEHDFACHINGVMAWIENLSWNGKDEFNRMEYKNWIIDGNVEGIHKTHKGFTLIRVKEAGHSVPNDKPRFALEMINKFIFHGINN